MAYREVPPSRAHELPRRWSTMVAHGRLYLDYLGPRGFGEQIDHIRVAGEDQDLIGLGKVREGLGGQSGTLWVEIYQHFVDNHRQTLGMLPELPHQAETESQV